MGDCCRVCRSSQVVPFLGAHGRYLRCEQCRAILRDISLSEYRALNPTYDPGPSIQSSSIQELRTFLAVQDRRKVLEPLVRRYPGSCDLLDVGCGAGGYLQAARELGCTAKGLEPSATHATVGRTLGLDIEQAYFEPGMFPDESFDLVILSHVIEHIYDPQAFLAELYRVVRPGGTLLVITPSADSLVARLSGREWVMLKPIDHVSMLSERSFESMGVHGWGEVKFSRSEFVWEPLASLASAALTTGKRVARSHQHPDKDRQAANSFGARTQSNKQFAWYRRAAVRGLFSLVGGPLHVMARLTRSEACLRMELRKPARDSGYLTPAPNSALSEHDGGSS